MKFNKHGLAILYKEPVVYATPATPRVFITGPISDVHVGSISTLGSRGAGKSMLTESLRDIWNEIQ